jgi:hypothetical protein
MKNKPTKPKLLASKFIKWYFNDRDEVISLGNSMRHLLETTGQCSLSMEELFDNCGYIPKYLCEIEPTKDMYNTDYNTNEVELINDFN